MNRLILVVAVALVVGCNKGQEPWPNDPHESNFPSAKAGDTHGFACSSTGTDCYYDLQGKDDSGSSCEAVGTFTSKEAFCRTLNDDIKNNHCAKAEREEVLVTMKCQG